MWAIWVWSEHPTSQQWCRSHCAGWGWGWGVSELACESPLQIQHVKPWHVLGFSVCQEERQSFSDPISKASESFRNLHTVSQPVEEAGGWHLENVHHKLCSRSPQIICVPGSAQTSLSIFCLSSQWRKPSMDASAGMLGRPRAHVVAFGHSLFQGLLEQQLAREGTHLYLSYQPDPLHKERFPSRGEEKLLLAWQFALRNRCLGV